jgi:hypothetical protein
MMGRGQTRQVFVAAPPLTGSPGEMAAIAGAEPEAATGCGHLRPVVRRGAGARWDDASPWSVRAGDRVGDGADPSKVPRNPDGQTLTDRRRVLPAVRIEIRSAQRAASREGSDSLAAAGTVARVHSQRIALTGERPVRQPLEVPKKRSEPGLPGFDEREVA